MRAAERGTRAIRVLIADDEDMFVELIQTLLVAEEGIRVVGRARNGEEAVELSRTLAPDVIVMDIGMPVLDGIEATRRIRQIDPAAQVVIFTGSDEARDVQRAREVGAAAFVQKPHMSALLTDAICRAAEQGVPRSTSKASRRLQAAVALG